MKDTVLCDGCYTEAIARVKAQMNARGPSKLSKPSPAPPPPLDQDGEDRQLAEVISRSVAAAGSPIARLDQRLGMERNSPTLTRAIAIAREAGLIELVNGKGFVQGPNSRKVTRLRSNIEPVQLGRVIWHADETLTRPQLQAKLGVSSRTLSRLIAPARAAGWIVSVRGQGYACGPNKPPEKTDAG